MWRVLFDGPSTVMMMTWPVTVRCSEPGQRALLAIYASRGPGRWAETKSQHWSLNHQQDNKQKPTVN
jgi:hypothetical protein